MIDYPMLLMWLLAGGFFAVAGWVAVVQRRAKTCSVHDKNAGRAAVVLAAICVVVGCGLIALSLVI
ncbi:MAG: hypothetical protein RIC55_13050 [Pirellulaceae bacterium]